MALDKVTTGVIADNAIDSDQFVDGSIDTAHLGDDAVTTVKIANDQVTGAKIENDPTIAGNLTVTGDLIPSAPLSHRNMIINGGMQVWQRSASVAVGSALAVAGYFTADRWATAGFANSDNYNATLSRGTVDGNALLEGHEYSYKITTTEPEVAIAADEEMHFRQVIEAQNLQHLAYGTASAKTTTLSFWVKSSITGVFAFSIYQADGVRVIGSTYTISSANTFEKKTITFAGDTSGTINNDNMQGLYLRWFLAVGSNFTGTANTTWAANSDAAAGNLHAGNAFATTDNATWEITGVQFEVGSNVTPFEHRSYGDELARCQRYCIVLDQNARCWPGRAFGGATVDACIPVFPVEMRDTPSHVQQGTAAIGMFYMSDGSNDTATINSVSFVHASKTGGMIRYATGGGITNGPITTQSAYNSWEFNAEL